MSDQPMPVVEIIGQHIPECGRRGRIVRDDGKFAVIVLLFPTADDPKPKPMGFGKSAIRELTNSDR